VAGLSAAEALHDAAGVDTTIKWPNDLLLSGRKLGGILVEARDGAVVVGLGINVSTELNALPPEAASLATADAARCSREDLAAAFCRRLSWWYLVWQRDGAALIEDALRPRMRHDAAA
jgi:BirA family biotin operon repressor/biotin-[acetyl-CoA-carboxylase] ligase